MDDQTLTIVIVNLGHVGINGNGRQLAHDIEALAQGLIDIGIVRIWIVVVQCQEGVLQLVHQIFARQAEEVHFQKVIGQIVAVLQYLTEGLQFVFCRLVSEEAQEACFFV